MATFVDSVNDFHELNERQPLSSSTQLVMLHLLYLRHKQDYLGVEGDTLRISDRELEYRTRLSKQTITESKRTLKNRGLIDFHTNRKKPTESTLYTFPFFSEKVGQELGQEVGQRVGQQLGQSGFVSCTQNSVAGASNVAAATEKGKESSPRTPFKEKEKEAEAEADAHARDNPPAAMPTHTRAKPLSSSYTEDPNDIQDLWTKAIGFALQGDSALELERLAGLDFGRARQALMRTEKGNEAKAKANGLGLNNPFAYFKKVYNGLIPQVGVTTNPNSRANSQKVSSLLDSLEDLQKNVFGERKD